MNSKLLIEKSQPLNKSDDLLNFEHSLFAPCTSTPLKRKLSSNMLFDDDSCKSETKNYRLSGEIMKFNSSETGNSLTFSENSVNDTNKELNHTDNKFLYETSIPNDVKESRGESENLPSRSIPKPAAFLTTDKQCKMSRKLFDKLVVLSQVDRKFISCLAEEEERKYIILIDQHAAHERVYLEKLVQIHCGKVADGYKICSSALHPHLNLSLSPERVTTIGKSIQELGHLGLTLTVGPDAASVIVTHIPTCFLERESNEVRRGRNSVYQQLAESLINDAVHEIEERGSLNLHLLPPTVRNVLNSLACHNAVKFGDALSMNQCIQLTRALSQCQMPFQCAHGRPVIAPLVDLADLEQFSDPSDVSRPQYDRLQQPT